MIYKYHKINKYLYNLLMNNEFYFANPDELNDPMDQKSRFEEQQKLRDAGDSEAQMMDEDFVTALEYGMPPTGGFGMSERVFAFLMDKPIRETVFFPPMRKE